MATVTNKNKPTNTMETLTPPQPAVTTAPTPPTLSVMGKGTEIRELHELEQFHTPQPFEQSDRNYHEHNRLTPHSDFARRILNGCRHYGLVLDEIAMKVDGVEEYKTEPKNWTSAIASRCLPPKKIANRFFLIARVRNYDFQVADDVETFIIARNSHDKRVPMEFAIGNKVIVCSNLMFGGDIAIKAKNSRFGIENFASRLNSLLSDYRNNVAQTRKDIEFLKSYNIKPEEGLSFIGYNASKADFIQQSRTAQVCDMFIKPEHPEPYQDSEGREKYTLWRLLNAYTYAHRGDLAIDPKTNEPYPDARRKGAATIENKKKYTAALWSALSQVKLDGYENFNKKWYNQVS